jgi:hypothetical protein
VLYPLSYEGMNFGNTWSDALFLALHIQVYDVSGSCLGRTVTTIHAFGQRLVVVIEQM